MAMFSSSSNFSASSMGIDLAAYGPFILGFVLVIIGTVWLFIEGNILRKEFEKDNNRRVNRIVAATMIAVIGIIIITFAGLMLAIY